MNVYFTTRTLQKFCKAFKTAHANMRFEAYGSYAETEETPAQISPVSITRYMAFCADIRNAVDSIAVRIESPEQKKAFKDYIDYLGVVSNPEKECPIVEFEPFELLISDKCWDYLMSETAETPATIVGVLEKKLAELKELQCPPDYHGLTYSESELWQWVNDAKIELLEELIKMSK